jgi:HEAT repeat protein
MSVHSTDIQNILRLLHASRNEPTGAGRLLADLVEFGDGVVGRLIPALGNAEAEVRSGAALALGYISFCSDGRYDLSPALPALFRLADGRDSWVSFHAAKSLWNFHLEKGEMSELDGDEVVDRIAACFHSSDPQLRVAVAEQLGMIWRFAEPPIPQLIDCLDDPVVEVACAAAKSLATYGPTAVDAISTLMEWVNSDNPAKVFFGSFAIMRIDEAYYPALVPTLLDALQLLDGRLHQQAIYATGLFCEIGDQAVPVLARWYTPTGDRGVRLAVVSVLAYMFDGEPQEALPVLIEAVRDDEDLRVVEAAAKGLRWRQRDVEVALPHLTARLQSELARQDVGDLRERELRCELIDDLRDAIRKLKGAER